MKLLWNLEIRTENEDWEELNINSLFIELIQSGINITLNKLEILLKSHLISINTILFTIILKFFKMEQAKIIFKN
jgi:hypothetical protein